MRAAPARPGDGAAFSPTDWAMFLAISGIWGASFLFIKVGLEAMEPGVVTVLRVGLGAAILHVLPGTRMKLEPDDRARMAALSVIWVGVPFTIFPIAEQHINSAVTGLLNGATPLFAALFAALFFAHRTAGAQLLGVAVGFIGIVLISIPSADDGGTEAWGVGLVLFATVCYGFATNLSAPLQHRYGSRPVMARMLALATVWTLPFGLSGLGDSTIEARPLLAVSVLGLVGTGIAFLLMGMVVHSVGPTRATFITYLMPPVSLALGVAFQDDHVEALALLGVVFAAGGAILASRAERGPVEPALDSDQLSLGQVG